MCDRISQRMRWLDGITDSVHINLGTLWALVKVGEPGMLQPGRSQRLRHDGTATEPTGVASGPRLRPGGRFPRWLQSPWFHGLQSTGLEKTEHDWANFTFSLLTNCRSVLLLHDVVWVDCVFLEIHPLNQGNPTCWFTTASRTHL